MGTGSLEIKHMKKSTITCDMEGVIETMNEGAEKIFGYKKEELIGIKRVSIFSPGEIVLQNVAKWLDTAVKNGIYEGETIFLNKNKEKINAKIRITPTFKNGKDNPQTGYCGVTEVIDKDVNVKINTSTNLIKWLAITRLPFTSASVLPIFVIAAYFAFVGDDLFNMSALIFSLMGVIFAHLSVNVFNSISISKKAYFFINYASKSLTFMRCFTLFIMPRTLGVSSNSLVLPILFNPRPISVFL